MIALLLKKPDSLKTTRKKQLKLLITTIKILQRPLLEIDPPSSAILILNVRIELPAILILTIDRTTVKKILKLKKVILVL